MLSIPKTPMRTICLLLALGATTGVAAQTFAKKDHVIQWNNGFHVVNFFTEQQDTLNIVNADAGSRHTSLQYEWAATNWLGIGLSAGSVSYFAETDSNNIRPNIKSSDFGLLFNGHFAPGPKFDFSGQLFLGTSKFSFRNNQPGDAFNTYNGRGNVVSVRMNGRYYVKHMPLAIGMYYGLTLYNYNGLKDRKDNSFNINGLGPDMGISLSLRLRPKTK
jgi:hypothetical protein